MKTKLFFAAIMAATMVACSNDAGEYETTQTEEPTEVTLTFSPYQMAAMSRVSGEPTGTRAMTRATVSIADVVTKLDVWIYESGIEVQAFQQESGDADFGTITATLDKTKTYTLYAVAHRVTSGHATLEDGVITFPDNKVTHSMFYTETFSPGTKTSLSCLMTRIVAQFSFSTTDACPADVAKMRFTIAGVYDRWNVTTGGTHQLDRVSNFESFSRHDDGTVTFNLFAIVTDAQTLHTVTVEAFDASDNLKQTRTFADVPLRNGYRTTYRGIYFKDTETTGTFTVDEWNDYDVVNF